MRYIKRATPVFAGYGAILAAVLSVGALTAANAADLPAKAPAPTGFPYSSSGVFWGIFTEGGGGAVNGNVAGVNPNSLVTNQLGLGVAVGYIWARPNSAFYYDIEGRIGYRNFNATQPGLSLTGPMSADLIFEAGVPTDALIGVLPNFGLPTMASFPALPNGATITNTRTGLFAGLHIDDISTDICGAGGCGSNKDFRFAPEVGAALTGQVSNGTVVKAWVKTIFPDKGACIGPNSAIGCAGLGQQFIVGGGVYF